MVTLHLDWEAKRIQIQRWTISKSFVRVVGIIIAVIAIAGTAAYAWAFTRIYTRPVTRVAATDWIIENVPGPINLKMKTEQGEVNYPVGYRYQAQVQPGKSLQLVYIAEEDAQVTKMANDMAAKSENVKNAFENLMTEKIITEFQKRINPTIKKVTFEEFIESLQDKPTIKKENKTKN